MIIILLYKSIGNPINFAVIVVGFEVVEMTAEETLPFAVIATVALFQGQTEREFVVGVRTLNGTATG